MMQAFLKACLAQQLLCHHCNSLDLHSRYSVWEILIALQALHILAYAACVFSSAIPVLWLVTGILESIEESLLAIK